MARKPRLELPGSLYYVIVRGNQKQRIFHDNEDGITFLDRLGRYKDRFQFDLFAYVMMPTAIHILIENPNVPLSKVMQGLQQSYTQFYNRKYNINGHVFQGRYQAYIVEKERYMQELVRHIHLCPVHARIALEPEAYVWSGHYELHEKRPEPLIDWKKLLLSFAPDIPEGLNKYLEFVREGIDREFTFPIEGRQVIGSKEFAMDVFRQAGLEKEYETDEPKITLDRITEITADLFRIPKDEIRSGSKYHNLSAARRAVMYVAVEKFKFSNRAVSEYLNRSPATVSLQIFRAKTSLREDEEIRRLYQTLEKLIQKETDSSFLHQHG